jgi:hypothetical protein
LWWKFCNLERDIYYQEGKEYLENLGYVIKSVTGDGNLSYEGFFLMNMYFKCV